jgi:diguanylate cyclase (GGDEF)-like protein
MISFVKHSFEGTISNRGGHPFSHRGKASKRRGPGGLCCRVLAAMRAGSRRSGMAPTLEAWARGLLLLVLEACCAVSWYVQEGFGWLVQRFPRLSLGHGMLRRQGYKAAQSAAKAYTQLTWARVGALTTLLVVLLFTIDMSLGHLVAFRIIYTLPIWLAARLGGAGSGVYAMALVGILCSLTDPIFQAPHDDSAVANFAVRWAGLGAFLITVLHIEAALKLAREQAEHDSLTGLANRHTIERLAERALGESSLGMAHLAVADCDRFKALNDAFGHAFGDHVLRVLARQLEAVTRGAGTVARVGGDEFVVLFQGIELDRAQELMARANARFSLILSALDCPARVSYGLATCGPDGATYPELYRRADERMYANKRARHAGRAAIEVGHLSKAV